LKNWLQKQRNSKINSFICRVQLTCNFIRIEKRETRSRERKEIVDDISWINEKNRVFNQKIARFYDKYTKEIRENLERGTAL
jgi:hypothetical protein